MGIENRATIALADIKSIRLRCPGPENQQCGYEAVYPFNREGKRIYTGTGIQCPNCNCEWIENNKWGPTVSQSAVEKSLVDCLVRYLEEHEDNRVEILFEVDPSILVTAKEALR